MYMLGALYYNDSRVGVIPIQTTIGEQLQNLKKIKKNSYSPLLIVVYPSISFS